MVQPFRVRDGDDPGADQGGWDEDGNIDIPGVLTVDTVRGSGSSTPALTTTAFQGQATFAAGVTMDVAGTVAGVRVPTGEFTPQDHGFAAWTHDPYYPASSVIAVNGRIYAVKLLIRRNMTVDTLWWSVATAGATPTAGQNEVGLYSSAGVKLASTNVDAVISSTGGKSTAITAQSLTAGTFVWQLFLFNAATAPTLVRGSSFESTPSINLATTALRAAVVASAQTALPASFDPANLVTTNCLTFWAALEEA